VIRLLAIASLALIGCSAGGDGGPVDEPLPDLPIVDAEADENGHFPIDILDGLIPVWPDRITRLPRGPADLLVRNRAQQAEDPDTQVAIALWLRGRGSRVHFLPQYSSRPLLAQTMEDWPIDLVPGTYDLSVSMGGDRTLVSIVLVE
jgi:hypothetical protein